MHTNGSAFDRITYGTLRVIDVITSRGHAEGGRSGTDWADIARSFVGCQTGREETRADQSPQPDCLGLHDRHAEGSESPRSSSNTICGAGWNRRS